MDPAVVDYQKLCRELFGTDDAAALEQLAKTLQQKKPRGAGRKRKFSETELAEMHALAATGMSVNALAARYHTSRQIIHKYLTPAPRPGCTLRMIYMFGRHPCTVIDVDFAGQKVYIQNRTDDVLHRAFGILETPTWQDLELFLQERCMPATRGLLKTELRRMGLDSYDPFQIAEKTKGCTAEDDLWLKFQYYPQGGSIACSK